MSRLLLLLLSITTAFASNVPLKKRKIDTQDSLPLDVPLNTFSGFPPEENGLNTFPPVLFRRDMGPVKGDDEAQIFTLPNMDQEEQAAFASPTVIAREASTERAKSPHPPPSPSSPSPAKRIFSLISQCYRTNPDAFIKLIKNKFIVTPVLGQIYMEKAIQESNIPILRRLVAEVIFPLSETTPPFHVYMLLSLAKSTLWYLAIPLELAVGSRMGVLRWMHGPFLIPPESPFWDLDSMNGVINEIIADGNAFNAHVLKNMIAHKIAPSVLRDRLYGLLKMPHLQELKREILDLFVPETAMIYVISKAISLLDTHFIDLAAAEHNFWGCLNKIVLRALPACLTFTSPKGRESLKRPLTKLYSLGNLAEGSNKILVSHKLIHQIVDVDDVELLSILFGDRFTCKACINGARACTNHIYQIIDYHEAMTRAVEKGALDCICWMIERLCGGKITGLLLAPTLATGLLRSVLDRMNVDLERSQTPHVRLEFDCLFLTVNRPELFSLLLEKGANPNAIIISDNVPGKIALHCLRKGLLRQFEQLLAKGAIIDKKHCLMIACSIGRLEEVKEILNSLE